MLIRHSVSQIIGRFSALLCGVIAAPVYIAYLGAESYGIVGIYMTFFAFLSLFDFGLPVSVNRQVSVMIANKEPEKQLLTLIRTYELLIFSVAFIGAAVLVLLSDFVAQDWLNQEKLSEQVMKTSLILAAVAAMLRFPVAFYSNVLFAFERHFSSNAVTVFFSIARLLITVAVLEFYSITLTVFFWCQIVINLCEMLLFYGLIWFKRRSFFWVKPAWSMLRNNVTMTLSLTGISVTALLQSQIDKVLLSKWLSLSDFGVYSLASSFAMGLLPIAYAIGNATFPSLSRAISTHNVSQKDVNKTLSQANALLILLVLPLGITLTVSSEQLTPFFDLFTEKSLLLSALLAPMFLGAIAQSNIVLPHQFRVAEGKAHIISYINLGFLLPYAVILYYCVQSIGIMGAAYAFAFVNFLVCITHYILLFFYKSNHSWKTIIKTNIVLFIVCISLAMFSHSFITESMKFIYFIATMLLTWLLLAIIIAFSCPFLISELRKALVKKQL